MIQTTRPRMSRPRGVVLASFVAIAVGVAACGGSDSSSTPDTKAAPAASQSGTDVVIDTFMFGPTTIKVHVGDTVTWTNHDDILHTVTSGTREYASNDGGKVTATNKDGLFDMELDGRDSTGKHTFTEAGSFHYFCDRHPGMEADIEVS